MGICQCRYRYSFFGWMFSARPVVSKHTPQTDEAKLGSYIIVNTTDTNTYCIQLIERLPSVRHIRIHNRTTGKRETLLSHLVLEALNYQPSFDRERVLFALLNRDDCDLVPCPPTKVICDGANAKLGTIVSPTKANTVDAYSSPFFRVLLRLSNANQRGTVVDIHRARIFFTRLLEKMFDHPSVKEYVYYLMGFTNQTKHPSSSLNRYRYNYYRHAIEEPPTIAGEHFRMLIYAESIHPWIRGRIDSIIKELEAPKPNPQNPEDTLVTTCAVYENPTYISPDYVQPIQITHQTDTDVHPVRATLYSPH